MAYERRHYVRYYSAQGRSPRTNVPTKPYWRGTGTLQDNAKVMWAEEDVGISQVAPARISPGRAAP